MSYLVDKPPTEDAVLKTGQRSWEIPEHRPNLTASRAAYKPYSTYVVFARIHPRALGDVGWEIMEGLC